MTGQTLSGEDLEKLIVDELAQGGAGTDTGNKSEPIRIKMKDEEYTFTDAEQLGKTLEGVVGNYQTQLQAAMAKIEELSQVQSLSKQGSYVKDDEGPTFDMKHYIETLEKNPIKAAEYVDNFRYFDGKVDNASALIKERLNRSEELERTVAVYQFKDAHPEFPGGPEAAKIIEGVRSRLGLPFNADGLDAAYSTAISKGFLPNYKQQAQEAAEKAKGGGRGDREEFYQEQGGFGNFKQTPRGLPNVNSRQGGGNEVADIDYDSLSLDQLERILKKATGGR